LDFFITKLPATACQVQEHERAAEAISWPSREGVRLLASLLALSLQPKDPLAASVSTGTSAAWSLLRFEFLEEGIYPGFVV
jgi:predicted O-methyltransferase YrrM